MRNFTVFEVGLNHLGDEKYFNDYIKTILKLGLKEVTFQIREKKYYNIHFKLIDRKIFLRGLNLLKKNNVSVGLSICDLYYKSYLGTFNPDFFKILSWKINDLKLLRALAKENKKIYLALGLLRFEKIINLKNKIEKLGNNFEFIYTQYQYLDKNTDLSLIKTINNLTNINVSYGHHGKTLASLYLAKVFEAKKIFVYIKLNKKLVHPDEEHAIYLKDLKLIMNGVKIVKSHLISSPKKIRYRNDKKMQKVFCFDLDNVICKTKGVDYDNSIPFKNVISKINSLYKNNIILVFTARYFGRSKGSVAIARNQGYDKTSIQLKSWGLKFDELIFGKPVYDVFVDDKNFEFKKDWLKKFNKIY